VVFEKLENLGMSVLLARVWVTTLLGKERLNIKSYCME